MPRSRSRGRLRIIAGLYRGRQILVPEGESVRPTADRVREALFSILGGRLDGAKVLDVFAGSGALGLEALSRGAASVTFVEADREVGEILRENVRKLDAGRDCTIRIGEAESVIPAFPEETRFDLVLADPPYTAEAVRPLLEILAGSGCLAAEGRVVVERASVTEPRYDGLFPLVHQRTASYGRVSLDFFRHRPSAGRA